MKVNYNDLMTKLGVGRPMTTYDTQPWITYDSAKNMTCEAEVRTNHDLSEIECEIQLMPDTPLAGKPPVDQICNIRIEQLIRLDKQYTVTSCIIRGEEWKGKLYDWETKSCNFFRSCVRDIKAEKIPDVDDILSKEMKDSGIHGRGRGDGSNKSPKINASQLMYDRKGIGAGF